MNWEEAEINLRENIHINDHLGGFGHYKIVTQVPKNDKDYFRIQVGKTSYINVSINIIEELFRESLNRNRIYNKNVFFTLFPQLYKNKPCYVHAIGKLFVFAGVAVEINSRNYRLL